MIRLFKHYIPISLLALALVEAGLFFMAPFFGMSVWSWWKGQHADADTASLLVEAFFMMVVLVGAMSAMGLYHRRLSEDLRDWWLRIALAFVAGGLALFILFYLFSSDTSVFFIGILIASLTILLIRSGFFFVADRSLLNRRVLVLGAGDAAQEIEKLRRRSDFSGLTLIGFVSLNGDESLVSPDKIIHAKADLSALVRQHFVDEIVVAVKDRRKKLPVHELLECKMLGVEVIDQATFFERQLGKVRLDVLNPSWLIFSDGFGGGSMKYRVKRAFDVLASLLLLALVWPLMLLTMLAIYAESGFKGTIFYRQVRVGEMCRNFEVIKFRSMREDAEKDGVAQWATTNDSRVTRVGNFIRKTRIDELPQLLNVLRGDMSFVGPRPERPQFVGQLNESIPYYKERHMVKPGITGWAQIRYPYGASEEDAREKLQYDLYYVKNYSLFLDFAIFLQTAEVILWGKGAR